MSGNWSLFSLFSVPVLFKQNIVVVVYARKHALHAVQSHPYGTSAQRTSTVIRGCIATQSSCSSFSFVQAAYMQQWSGRLLGGIEMVGNFEWAEEAIYRMRPPD